MIALISEEFAMMRFLSRSGVVVPRRHAVLLTAADRATEGIPTEAQLDDAVREEERREDLVSVGASHAGRPSENGRGRRWFHPPSAAVGAVAGGLLAWIMGRDRF